MLIARVYYPFCVFIESLIVVSYLFSYQETVLTNVDLHVEKYAEFLIRHGGKPGRVDEGRWVGPTCYAISPTTPLRGGTGLVTTFDLLVLAVNLLQLHVTEVDDAEGELPVLRRNKFGFGSVDSTNLYRSHKTIALQISHGSTCNDIYVVLNIVLITFAQTYQTRGYRKGENFHYSRLLWVWT